MCTIIARALSDNVSLVDIDKFQHETIFVSMQLAAAVKMNNKIEI